MLPPPGGPASPPTMTTPPGSVPGRAVLAAALVVAGSVVTGIIAGLIWAAAAPRVQYQVYTLRPPTAYATNPETSAFIAADGWYLLHRAGRRRPDRAARLPVRGQALRRLADGRSRRRLGRCGLHHAVARPPPVRRSGIRPPPGHEQAGNLSATRRSHSAPTAHSPSGRWRPRRSPAASSWRAPSGPGASCRTAGSRCRAWIRSARAAPRTSRARMRRRLPAIRAWPARRDLTPAGCLSRPSSATATPAGPADRPGHRPGLLTGATGRGELRDQPGCRRAHAGHVVVARGRAQGRLPAAVHAEGVQERLQGTGARRGI